MLKKRQRLTKAEFDRYFKSGKRHHSANLQLIHAPHQQFSGAAVVGKKVFKSAVKRNRLRRQLYGVLYRTCAEKQGCGVCIIIAKASAKDRTRQELLAEARSLVGGIC